MSEDDFMARFPKKEVDQELRSALVAFALAALAGLPAVAALKAVHIGHDLFYGFADGDDLWLGAGNEGVFLASPVSGDVRHLVEGMGIPVNSTTCGVSAFGRIWLGSSGGLYELDGSGAWSRVGVEHLPSQTINCLAVQGRLLWIGTNRGVARYDPEAGSWQVYGQADGLSDAWVISICVSGDLVVFGTMRGGVCELNTSSNTWRSWKKQDGLVSNTVFSVSASPEYILAGTTSGLSVFCRRCSAWVNYDSVLPSSSVFATLWDSELGQGWIGTGKGLAIWYPSNMSIHTIAKVGEIELGRVNSLWEARGMVWVTRATNQWFHYKTTGVIGFNRTSSTWLRPILLDVLVDQAGYGPGDGKRFIVQSNEPIEGEGTFFVETPSGRVVYWGVLGSRLDRADWDAYYWPGDFTPLERRGNFTIRAEIGGWSARSPRFEIDNEVLLQECGELIYEFLRYMRCGYSDSQTGWTTWLRSPRPCHLDDGVLPNGTHIDATGGWHCAGLWGGKYSEYHTYVLFNLLLAYDVRSDFFGAIDRDGNGLADILDEAMWGCDFLLKMQAENGSIYHEVEKVEQTDGIIGTSDDRKILGWVPTHNGLLAVAGLAGTSALVSERYPEDAARYLAGALRSFGYYASLVRGGLGSSVVGAAMVLACAQLYRATGNGTYLELAEGSCNATVLMRYSEYYGPFVPCALGYYLELNPKTALRDVVARYIVGRADDRVRADTAASNPHLPFEIPTWSLYIMDPWAAEVLFAYRLTGNRTYLDHALKLIDCHLGVNPYGMCFLEGAGTINPPSYASHFRSYANPRAAVPGSIPYRGLYFLYGKPFYEEGETWLINTNFLQAISLLPRDQAQYPLEVGERLAVGFAVATACLLLLARCGNRAGFRSTATSR